MSGIVVQTMVTAFVLADIGTNSISIMIGGGAPAGNDIWGAILGAIAIATLSVAKYKRAVVR